MRKEIKEKFCGIKHKWIYFSIDSYVFNDIINGITKGILCNKIKSKEAINLVKAFLLQEKAFVKFSKICGRKNISCLCFIIDEKNNKLEIEISPDDILSASLLNKTPKSLKLYNTKEKTKNEWKKPDDGFIDPIEWPPVEEELTELGYEMYKSWQLEIQASGLSAEEYKKKIFNRGYY